MHINVDHIGPYRIAAYYSAQITRGFVLLPTVVRFLGSDRSVIPGPDKLT